FSPSVSSTRRNTRRKWKKREKKERSSTGHSLQSGPARRNISGRGVWDGCWTDRRMSMTVRTILDAKGRDVVTIAADETLASAAERLVARRIGALVVTADNGRIAGILSERDIVRAIVADGPGALERP